jgi:hypothetical protein
VQAYMSLSRALSFGFILGGSGRTRTYDPCVINTVL